MKLLSFLPFLSPFPVTLAWQAQLTNIGRKCHQPLKQNKKKTTKTNEAVR